MAGTIVTPAKDHLLQALRAQAGRSGWLRELGTRHHALHMPGDGTLLVTFEQVSDACDRVPPAPWSNLPAATRDYATLTILADGRSWFRDGAIEHLFDELTDEGFFDDYDEVIFAGGGPGGYAAAAYSVAAPGATVLAVQPVATLDRSRAPWERRFRSAWSLSWGPRYGYAPEMIDAAARVYVVSDPTEIFDSMHASLFQGPHVTHLSATHAGADVWARLQGIGILDRLVASAVSGRLTPLRFAQLWRGRRQDREWLAGMLRKLDRRGRPWLTAIFARHMAGRVDSGPARRRLLDAAAQLAAQGRAVPGGDGQSPGLARQASAARSNAG